MRDRRREWTRFIDPDDVSDHEACDAWNDATSVVGEPRYWEAPGKQGRLGGSLTFDSLNQGLSASNPVKQTWCCAAVCLYATFP